MRGQKRVEDARERAYDPRIHLLRKRFFAKVDGLPGQARQWRPSVWRPCSGKPALQIRAHEGVVVEVRIGRADAVDLLLLPGSQRLARVETPDAFQQALAAQDFVAAGDHPMEVVGGVEDRRVAVGHLGIERQEFSGYLVL